MSDTELRLVAGGLYRNPMGAEMRAIEPICTSKALRKYKLPFDSASFGDIWVVESGGIFGGLHLATPEGLAACGYKRISECERGDLGA